MAILAAGIGRNFTSIIRSAFSPGKCIPVTIGQLKFRNPLGLAAGFDKNGKAIELWDALGFSHAEIGTVTPKPQPGNDKPRIFRLKEDNALINRLGFNNAGADAVRQNIFKARQNVSSDFVIGVNIGKNKNTGLDDAVSDYLMCFEILFDAGDYFTVNVSSPNTPGLRQLQDDEHLKFLLSSLSELNFKLSRSKNLKPKNIFLKIAPDVSSDSIESIYKICSDNNITAIIATNTTITRSGLKLALEEAGGLSGKPLTELSNSVLAELNSVRSKLNGRRVGLIGVGGVFSKNDYERKLSLGASLVQVYTGFVYEGPGIVKKLLN